MRCFAPNRLRLLASPCVAASVAARRVTSSAGLLVPAASQTPTADTAGLSSGSHKGPKDEDDGGIRFVYEPPRRFVLAALRKRRQGPPTATKPRVDLLVEGNPLATSPARVDSLASELRRDAAEALVRVLALKVDEQPRWKMPRMTVLSLVLCDDPHIRHLNSLHRGKDAPTDVLSFEMEDEMEYRIHLPVKLMGDLVVSLDTAERQARERGHSLHAECRILLVHGLLHLAGWDHERGPDEHEAMAAAERRLLAELGWSGSGLIAAAEAVEAAPEAEAEAEKAKAKAEKGEGGEDEEAGLSKKRKAAGLGAGAGAGSLWRQLAGGEEEALGPSSARAGRGGAKQRREGAPSSVTEAADRQRSKGQQGIGKQQQPQAQPRGGGGGRGGGNDGASTSSGQPTARGSAGSGSGAGGHTRGGRRGGGSAGAAAGPSALAAWGAASSCTTPYGSRALAPLPLLAGPVAGAMGGGSSLYGGPWAAPAPVRAPGLRCIAASAAGATAGADGGGAEASTSSSTTFSTASGTATASMPRRRRTREVEIVALDLDGTLLDSRSRIRHSSVAAIRAAAAAGVTVVAATGKARPAALAAAAAAGLDAPGLLVWPTGPGVFLQGLAVHGRGGEALSDAALPARVVEAAFSYSAATGVSLVAFLGDSCATTRLTPELVELHTTYYEPLAEEVPSVSRLLSGPPVRKLLFMADPAAVSTQLIPHWRAQLEGPGAAGGAQVMQAVPNMLEIVPSGVNKWGGLTRLLDHLGLPPGALMAVGDGGNDLEMVARAGLGVAMGNAVPDVKAAAGAVVAGHDEDGVAEAFERFVL